MTRARRRRTLRIFISSPGDVGEERSLARKVIRRLSEGLPEGCVLFPVDWTDRKSRTAFLATLTPQQAIDRGLPAPDKCSVVLVILWSRLGTPLDPEKSRKPDNTPYLSGTEYEYEIAMARARVENRPKVMVFRRTNTPSVDLDDPRYEEKGQQWKLVRTFFSQFQKSGSTWLGSYESYATPAEFERLLEPLLKKEIDAILAADPTADELAALEQPLWQGSPFPGLRPFQPEDAPIFFGRERETDELIAQLAQSESRFLAVAGASGSGKSSLVRAGLIPRLMENGIEGSRDWRWACFTPGAAGGDPFLALAKALADVGASQQFEPAELAASLSANPMEVTRVSAAALEGASPRAELLLVVDQFEELFTIVPERQRVPFIDFIGQAARDPRIRIVTTLRADLYHRCIEMPGLAALLRSAYPLPPPTAMALAEMIRRPADYAGLEFEGDLVERILSGTGTSPGSLALMAYLLDELYRESVKANTRLLTYAAYQALGEVKGAIAHRAEDCFNGLDAEAQAALPTVFEQLVHVDDHGVVARRPAPLAAFQENAAALRLIEGLTQSRLLVKSQSETLQPIVETGHEALLKSWERLDLWIRSKLDDWRLLAQMRTAAGQWVSHGRGSAYLWTHDRAADMIGMLLRLKPQLDPNEQEFARPEAAHLLGELAQPETTHDRRAQIGDRLDALGDSRPGIGLRSNNIPDLEWLRIEATPAGYTGRDSTDVMIQGLGTVAVRSFYIARYPVTYAQYLAFLRADDGFNNSRWWGDLGISNSQRLNPGIQLRQSRNHPAENVSWYDAVAACRWMSARLGYQVRLPEEAEWQLAAGGNKFGQEYPWGKDWRPGLANTLAGKLNRTVACGMYPDGASPSGVLDMCGNVYEWTASLGYEADKKIVRGGSWYHPSAAARISSRQNFFAYERLSYCGFRLAASTLPDSAL